MNKRKKIISGACALSLIAGLGTTVYFKGNEDKLAVNESTEITQYDVNAKTSAPFTTMKTTTSLNVRKGKSSKTKKLGTLNKNTTISVNSISNGWAKFVYKGSTGYVSSKYLKEVATTMYANANVTVKKDAGTKYSNLGTLKKSAKVDVVGQSGSWSKIKYNKGYGYVPSKNLTKTKPINYTTMYTTTSLTVRSGAGTKYKALATLKKATKVEVASTANGWAKIKYNKTHAYVSAKYLSKTKPAVSNNNNNNNNNNTNSNNNNNNSNNNNLNNNSNNSNNNAIDKTPFTYIPYKPIFDKLEDAEWNYIRASIIRSPKGTTEVTEDGENINAVVFLSHRYLANSPEKEYIEQEVMQALNAICPSQASAIYKDAINNEDDYIKVYNGIKVDVMYDATSVGICFID